MLPSEWIARQEIAFGCTIERICPNGHIRTPRNTRIYRLSTVVVDCRTCRRERGREFSASERAERDANEALRELRLWVLQERLRGDG